MMAYSRLFLLESVFFFYPNSLLGKFAITFDSDTLKKSTVLHLNFFLHNQKGLFS
jgi:hypothetical protein